MTQPDIDTPTELARRVGPVVAVVALVVGLGGAWWAGAGPTSVELPLAEAGYVVPGRLLVAAGEDGCVAVVDGNGTVDRRCDEDWAWAGGAWTPDGAIVLSPLQPSVDTLDEQAAPVPDDRIGGPPGQGPWRVVDPATWRVTEVAEQPVTVGAQVDGPGREALLVDARVVEVGGRPVLTLTGPPGTRLDAALVRPDGDWVAAWGGDGRVLVAPVDGSGPASVWFEGDGDVWWWDGLLWD
jgi:hypothetical protein